MEVVRVSSNCKLDLSIRNELLREVKLELDEEEVRSNDNDGILLFVKEDCLNRTWHLANFRAVFEIVGKTNRTRGATEEEQTVCLISGCIRILVDLKRAEDYICYCSILVV
jgi:hypothetical protein